MKIIEAIEKHPKLIRNGLYFAGAALGIYKYINPAEIQDYIDTGFPPGDAMENARIFCENISKVLKEVAFYTTAVAVILGGVVAIRPPKEPPI